MKKLVLIIIAIVCSLSTTANANQTGAREQAVANATAAQAITTISPAIFQKVEKLMKERGFKKIGVWEASEQGFRIRINKREDYNYVIIYWNGEMVNLTQDSWGGHTPKPLWNWEAIK